MRRVSVLVCVIGLLGAAGAAAADDDVITHGEFAVLLLRAGAGFTGELPQPEAALASVKELGLAPEEWTLEGPLTHGELADTVGRMGVSYVPADRDAFASRPFVEALLRRELSKLRDYLATRLGHGFSVNHILDQGVDRAVSPSRFD
jgi:hypothetical protein